MSRGASTFSNDLALAAVVLALLALLLGGCNGAPVDTSTAPEAVKASVGTSPSSRDMDDYYDREERAASRDAGHWVTIDRATGCHYLGSTEYTITPRMSRIENGRQYQVGCYVEDVMPMQEPVP